MLNRRAPHPDQPDVAAAASLVAIDPPMLWRVEPCLPTSSKRVPVGPQWVHEIKHDGYRLWVRRQGARVRVFTGVDTTGRIDFR
jgi:ATP-dependent DNA ligase